MTAPAWEAPFLRALERCGVASEAARLAGTGVRNAFKRRKRNATFAAAWGSAVAVHRAELGRQAMSALAAAGVALNSALDGGKLVAAGQSRWSRRAEEAFLIELAVGANVRRAADAAGFSATAVYRRRLKEPRFAEAWDAAIEAGKAKLEAMLVEAAQRRFDPDTLPIGDSEPHVSVGEALNIVKLRRSEPGRGPGNGGGREPRIATPEEAEKELIKRLKVFALRVQKEDIANGWSVHEGRSIPPGWVRAEEARCAKCGGPIGEEGASEA